ncbi:conserved hypothetical protein [Ricinus communis]|uniref:Uncharacterized protein n=1 Tax=Ricinus communis TaxID=3988 RepID=B9S6D4_RICCO|nr:conserved hypothetical protein [Ricinus communis]
MLWSSASSSNASHRQRKNEFPLVEDRDEPVLIMCRCAKEVRRRTSWMASNCDHFVWYDVEFSKRTKEVIQDFIDEVDRLKDINAEMGGGERRALYAESYRMQIRLEMEVKKLKMKANNLKKKKEGYLKTTTTCKKLLGGLET